MNTQRPFSRISRLGVLALLACAAFASGCATLAYDWEAPEVFLVGLEPVSDGEGGPLETRFAISLRVLNPNDRDIDLDGLDFTLDVNGRRLARGISSDGATIPRLSEGVVTIIATTTLFDLLNQAIGMSSNQALDYQLNGRVYLANSLGRLNFERTGRFDGSSLR